MPRAIKNNFSVSTTMMKVDDSILDFKRLKNTKNETYSNPDFNKRSKNEFLETIRNTWMCM